MDGIKLDGWYKSLVVKNCFFLLNGAKFIDLSLIIAMLRNLRVLQDMQA